MKIYFTIKKRDQSPMSFYDLYILIRYMGKHIVVAPPSAHHQNDIQITFGWWAVGDQACTLTSLSMYLFTASYYITIYTLNRFLFDLILYDQVSYFQLCRDESSWVEPVLSKD